MVSRVSPRIFMVLVVGIRLLWIVSCGWKLYSCGSDVKIAARDLEGEI